MTVASPPRSPRGETCLFGHYGAPNHCAGGANPGGGDLPDGCCFNYWWNNGSDPLGHGVTNYTERIGDDDTAYLSDSFERFVAARGGAPFVAQISFHNCHIPFVGSDAARAACAANETCRPPAPGAAPYTSAELDFYACLTELDAAVGRVLATLDAHGYGRDTMTWFTTDNGCD